MRFIGIDPGQKGGLAMVSNLKARSVPMPLHPKDDATLWGSPINWMAVYMQLRDWSAPGAFVVVEQVHAMPKQGVSSTFKFGGNYTGLLAVLQVLDLDYLLVVSRVWKKAVLGDTYGHDKEGAIQYCKERWPHLSLLATPRSKIAHDGMADALCLAAYGEERI